MVCSLDKILSPTPVLPRVTFQIVPITAPVYNKEKLPPIISTKSYQKLQQKKQKQLEKQQKIQEKVKIERQKMLKRQEQERQKQLEKEKKKQKKQLEKEQKERQKQLEKEQKELQKQLEKEQKQLQKILEKQKKDIDKQKKINEPAQKRVSIFRQLIGPILKHHSKQPMITNQAQQSSNTNQMSNVSPSQSSHSQSESPLQSNPSSPQTSKSSLDSHNSNQMEDININQNNQTPNIGQEMSNQISTTTNNSPVENTQLQSSTNEVKNFSSENNTNPINQNAPNEGEFDVKSNATNDRSPNETSPTSPTQGMSKQSKKPRPKSQIIKSVTNKPSKEVVEKEKVKLQKYIDQSLKPDQKQTPVKLKASNDSNKSKQTESGSPRKQRPTNDTTDTKTQPRNLLSAKSPIFKSTKMSDNQTNMQAATTKSIQRHPIIAWPTTNFRYLFARAKLPSCKISTILFRNIQNNIFFFNSTQLFPFVVASFSTGRYTYKHQHIWIATSVISAKKYFADHFKHIGHSTNPTC